MDSSEIKKMHQIQNEELNKGLRRVRDKEFVYSGDGHQSRLQAKISFLNELKRWLEKSFCFNNYQAEFIVNEAMNRVLKHSNEDMLVFYDTKKAEKLVRTSFLLGSHYFRFIMTMI